MSPFHLVLALVALASLALGQDPNRTPDCSAAERRESQQKHESCVDTVEARQVASGSGRRLVSLCQRMEEQVHKCGEHLAKCVSPADLRMIKDAQINAFTKFLDVQNLSHLYRNCEIVQEFRQSKRRPFKATELCRIDQIERAVGRRERCVQSQTLRMRNQMNKVSPFAKSEQTAILCEFVDKAMHECSEDLKECYTDDEFEEFTEKGYTVLSKILTKLESEFSLGDCETLATPVPLTDLNAASGLQQFMGTLTSILISLAMSKLF